MFVAFVILHDCYLDEVTIKILISHIEIHTEAMVNQQKIHDMRILKNIITARIYGHNRIGFKPNPSYSIITMY